MYVSHIVITFKCDVFFYKIDQKVKEITDNKDRDRHLSFCYHV